MVLPSNEDLLIDLHARFDQLQKKLVPLWEDIGRSDPGGKHLEVENTVVVLPSITVDVQIDIANQQAYEERMLFMLFLLRQPFVRVIFLSSLPVQQCILDYYLHILPSVTVSNARKRLFMVSPQEASARPLSRKLLDRPRLIRHIRSLIPNLDRAHLVPFNTTDLEREVALQIGIPMYAADPRFFAFGTKSGCRRIFVEEGLPHPLGAENLTSAADIARAIVQMRAQKPTIRRVIVKHNEGVSGFGNAQVDLSSLPEPGAGLQQQAVEECLRGMRFELPDTTYASYMHHLELQGGIVEELITGECITSPSAQLRVTPLGKVELLSTHDQMLGGPSGQVYLGARFPANPAYGPLIMREAEKIGRRFAREGIVGRFAIDFIAVCDRPGDWQIYAIEVNLRKGGTTHPFLTLQFLTGGCYELPEGVFRTARGQPKYYVASDNIRSPAYRAFTPEDLFDIVSETRLHFDHTTQTGIVMHMLSGVAATGRLGATAIGDTHEQAETLYQGFIQVLEQAAARSNAA